MAKMDTVARSHVEHMANHYLTGFVAIERRLEGAGKEHIAAIEKILGSFNTTNCGWHEYDAVPVIRRAIELRKRTLQREAEAEEISRWKESLEWVKSLSAEELEKHKAHFPMPPRCRHDDQIEIDVGPCVMIIEPDKYEMLKGQPCLAHFDQLNIKEKIDKDEALRFLGGKYRWELEIKENGSQHLRAIWARLKDRHVAFSRLLTEDEGIR